MENPLTNELILAVARIIIPILVGSLLSLAGAALLSVREFVISKIGELNYQRVVEVVRSAVLAAESNGLRGAIENSGSVKKDAALALVKRQLEILKLSNFIPEEELLELIEAEVLQGLNFPKLFPDGALTISEE